MKKQIIAFLLFMLIGVVSVKAYTAADVSRVINNGDVTKEFIVNMKKSDCEVTISATADFGLNITYHFKCLEEKEIAVGDSYEKVEQVAYDQTKMISLTENNGALEIDKDMTPQDETDDPYAKNVIELIPYWGVEMSSKYPQVKKYIDDNHSKQVIPALKEIFDRCYYVEMGVCYSAIPGDYKNTYQGKIKLDDTAADYALKKLKAEQRQIDSKKRNIMLIGVAGVILVLLMVAKSMAGNPAKKEPVVWSIENQNIKK